MQKENITGFSLRLNLDNEQHMRIYNVLHDLNVDIHKSKNQFIVEALDFYIKSFEDEELRKSATENQEKKQGWVRKADFEAFRSEMKLELRDELIQLLGSAMIGSKVATVEMGSQITQTKDSVHLQTENEDEIMSVTNPEAIKLINSWG